MGMYDTVTPSLPREPQEERTPRRERIDAIKTEIMKMSPTTGPTALARKYAEVRKQKQIIEEELSPVQELLDAVSELLISSFEEQGVSSVRIAETGQSISVSVVPTTRVRDKEALRQWCIVNGYEKAMSIHSSTLTSLVKEQLLQGHPTPEGVDVFARSTLSLRGK